MKWQHPCPRWPVASTPFSQVLEMLTPPPHLTGPPPSVLSLPSNLPPPWPPWPGSGDTCCSGMMVAVPLLGLATNSTTGLPGSGIWASPGSRLWFQKQSARPPVRFMAFVSSSPCEHSRHCPLLNRFILGTHSALKSQLRDLCMWPCLKSGSFRAEPGKAELESHKKGNSTGSQPPPLKCCVYQPRDTGVSQQPNKMEIYIASHLEDISFPRYATVHLPPECEPCTYLQGGSCCDTD